LVAGPLPPGPALPAVSRVTWRPASVSVTDAFAVTVPVEGLVNTIVHWPLLSVVPSHVDELWSMTVLEPSESVSVYWMSAPDEATKPLPSPESCITVTVRVWGSPATFVASAGVIVMNASTTASGSHGPSDGT